MSHVFRSRCPLARVSIVFLVLSALVATTATLSAAQTFTTLTSFQGNAGNGPVGAIAQGVDGSLYGTTINGGSVGNAQCLLNGCGTVFKVTTTGTVTHLYSFCSQPNCADGAFPTGGLVQGPDGSFYGVTSLGGTGCGTPSGCGTIFKITPAGVLTTLHNFCSQTGCPDGYAPGAGLVLADDGNFYGVTQSGGASHGTVFKITPGGTFTTLYNFCSLANCADGQSPVAPLTQAADGNFYGVTQSGGASHGTVFKITPSGNFTTIYNFCSLANCADGQSPVAPLTQAADGNLYGTTPLGGSSGAGTVFLLTLKGALKTLHNFNGNDGSAPIAGLLQAIDGNLYGTTQSGGDVNNPNCPQGGCGTVFKMNLGGGLTTIHRFEGPDGSLPKSALIQATDGILYGTTWYAGANGNFGTVFKITTGGTLTTLHAFNGSDGEGPSGPLLQDTDGNIYGTSGAGGSSGHGTFFQVNAGLTPFIKFQPSSGQAGTPITILGTNFSDITSVDFATASSSYQVISPSEIQTHVPSGAPTGSVHVNTSASRLVSNANFQVTTPLQFLAGTPCRLVDTRQTGGPIAAGTSRDFAILHQNTCGIPAAAAFSLNVTVIPHGPLGYLKVWPQGNVQPFVSTMNSGDGRIKANAVIVQAGNEAISIYASDTTDVILDINGYFEVPNIQSQQFYPVTPCRVADTRSSSFPQGLGAPHLSAGVARELPITASPCIPSNVLASAYSLNVTAIPYPGQGHPMSYLELWPTGYEPLQAISTLNNPTGTYVANAAVTAAGTDGKVTVLASDATDLAIDINGYFAAPGEGGLSLYPTAPCRVFDSRTVGNGQPFSGTLSPPVDVTDSPCTLPDTAQAYLFNATAVPSGSLSYLTLWPDGEGQPVVSTLNAADGWVTSNMAIVPSTNGKIDAYAAGMTQLVLDISSYFAP